MEVVKYNESPICTHANRDQVMESIEEAKERK